MYIGCVFDDGCLFVGCESRGYTAPQCRAQYWLHLGITVLTTGGIIDVSLFRLQLLRENRGVFHFQATLQSHHEYVGDFAGTVYLQRYKHGGHTYNCMSLQDDLATEDKDVLVAIERHGAGRAGDFADVLPDLDTRGVHYRTEKLTELGLVTREKQGDGQMSPVEITVTELGSQVAEELQYDHETVREELKKLRSQHRELIEAYSHQQDVIQELQAENQRLQDELADLEHAVDRNAEGIAGVKRFLSDRFESSE